MPPNVRQPALSIRNAAGFPRDLVLRTLPMLLLDASYSFPRSLEGQEAVCSPVQVSACLACFSFSTCPVNGAMCKCNAWKLVRNGAGHHGICQPTGCNGSPGQSGVVTCSTKPVPSSPQAITPLPEGGSRFFPSSSSREVRIRGAFFLWSISVGEPSPPKRVKGHAWTYNGRIVKPIRMHIYVHCARATT